MNQEDLEQRVSYVRTKKEHALEPSNEAVKLNLKVFNLMLLYLSFAFGMGVLYNIFADYYTISIFIIFTILVSFFSLIFYMFNEDKKIEEICVNLLSKEWSTCIYMGSIKDRKTRINLVFTSFMIAFYFSSLITPSFLNNLFSFVMFAFLWVLLSLIIHLITEISVFSLHRYLDTNVNTICEYLRKNTGNKLKIRMCKKRLNTYYVKFDKTSLALLIRKKYPGNLVWLTILNVNNKNVHLAYLLSQIIEESAGRGI